MLVDRCFGSFECREALQDAIRATQYPASEAHFEGRATLCQTSPMFQELYECTDTGDGVRAWRRSRCRQPDQLIPPQCATLLERIPDACPGTSELTRSTALAYTCPADCATAIVTAWEYCQTSFAAMADAAPDERKV